MSIASPSCIALLCPEPLHDRLQGSGIRALAMARVLAQDSTVQLWHPAAVGQRDGCNLHAYSDRGLRQALPHCTTVIALGMAVQWLKPWRRALPVPFVADLSDPFLVEHLHYDQPHLLARDRRLLLHTLARADRLLVASRAQWLFYAGLLAGIGRLSAAAHQRDPQLHSLLLEIPFGVEPPPTGGTPLRGHQPGLHPDDTLVFFGGLYAWYDPDLLLEALAHVLPQRPNVRLLFSRPPHADALAGQALDRLEHAAITRGWLHQQVHILPWLDYAERGAWLSDVDLAVVLHQPGLETELALRLRLLDCMACGVPLIVSRGGETGRIAQDSGAARLVTPNDVSELVEALKTLLDQPQLRQAMSQRGRQWVQTQHHWPTVLSPLRDYCASPYASAYPTCRAPTEWLHTPRQGWRYWRNQGTRAVLRRLFS